ncbi:MAG: SAM-dependent methyltransferase [Clostridia bacterium]|nr:SAM-dependent methyltransferase [Clostridia bacterium]
MKNAENFDRALNIKTSASGYEAGDENHARYEPTGYGALKSLASSGLIEKDDILVDYGCGKGRVSFFLHYALGVSAAGIEYDSEIYLSAVRNLESYILPEAQKSNIRFFNQSAESYQVTNENRFYFFNPFSHVILASVINQILVSYYENPRLMRLFFYYPSSEYLALLSAHPMLDFECEIDVSDTENGERKRERIMVYKIGSA